MPFDRIRVDPEIMAGVPCIEGTRIPVATIVGMVASGMTAAEIEENFPQITPDDVADALRYAAARVDERSVDLRRGA